MPRAPLPLKPSDQVAVTTAAALSIEALSVRMPGHLSSVLRDLWLHLAPGSILALSGASGCGKTTLLHTIAGLLPWARPAEVRGRILVGADEVSDLDPGQRAHLLATCLDRAEAQLFLGTPRQEVAAAARLHGTSGREAAVVERLGVGALLDRRIADLSSGERQRISLAIALLAAPRPVLLDEPTAHLDQDAVASLAAALADASRAGGTVLLTEHASWRLGATPSRWLELREGELHPLSPPAPPVPAPPRASGEEVVLSARGINLTRGGRLLLRDVDLELRAGEIVLLLGRNGAGKSSLARALAGHALAAGVRVQGRVQSAGRVALTLPSPELQLFSDTVAGELALTGATGTRAAAALHDSRLEHLAGRAPWTLSRGERQRLVHAVLDLVNPCVLVLDEPTVGLDPSSLLELARTVTARAAEGRAYLILTHRLELAAIAHRVLRIEGERVEG